MPMLNWVTFKTGFFKGKKLWERKLDHYLCVLFLVSFNLLGLYKFVYIVATIL